MDLGIGVQFALHKIAQIVLHCSGTQRDRVMSSPAPPMRVLASTRALKGLCALLFSSVSGKLDKKRSSTSAGIANISEQASEHH